jgi:RNA 3'-terminal phosphate cyclase (ATP)
MLTINGSQGEGGGQILRSSLALSLVTGTPITLSTIRAGRKKPGLQRQHLTAVKAAAAISEAETDGANVSSTELTFAPGQIKAGEYKFDVGTAGSVTLVLQTILPALMLADTPSSLILEGGTHNSMAPPFEFLQKAFLPLVGRMGPRVEVTLEQHGFYPCGGGRLSVSIRPLPQLCGLSLLERGEFTDSRVRAMVSNLPTHIARRQCETIARKSRWKDSCFMVEEIKDASGPGNVLLVELESEHVTEVFAGFGQKGVKAEHIATRVWNEVRSYMKSGVPVGVHLADQLMLPLSIAASQGQTSQFRTMSLTGHSKTHINILNQFLEIDSKVEENGRDDVVITFGPAC